LTRRGALMMGAAPIGLFARTRPGLVSPDVQYQFLADSFVTPGGKMHDFPACQATCIPCRQESRGWLRIRSPDPAAPPVIPRARVKLAPCRQAKLRFAERPNYLRRRPTRTP
jgi:choline dehydrogenase